MQKAFDKIQHQKMIQILKGTEMNDKDLRIIQNLYWNQVATIKISAGDETTNNSLLGVRKEFILSPPVFSLYSEKIFRSSKIV